MTFIHDEAAQLAHKTVCNALEILSETESLRIIPASGQKSLPKVFLDNTGKELLETVLSDWKIPVPAMDEKVFNMISENYDVGHHIYTVDAGTFSFINPQDNQPIFEGGLADACGSYENLMEALKPAKSLPAREQSEEKVLPLP